MFTILFFIVSYSFIGICWLYLNCLIFFKFTYLYCQTPGQLKDYLFCLGIFDIVFHDCKKTKVLKVLWMFKSLKKFLNKPWMFKSAEYLISSNALVQVEGLRCSIFNYYIWTATWGLSCFILPLWVPIYCYYFLKESSFYWYKYHQNRKKAVSEDFLIYKNS